VKEYPRIEWYKRIKTNARIWIRQDEIEDIVVTLNED
jgi:hypothetical protein